MVQEHGVRSVRSIGDVRHVCWRGLWSGGGGTGGAGTLLKDKTGISTSTNRFVVPAQGAVGGGEMCAGWMKLGRDADRM